MPPTPAAPVSRRAALAGCGRRRRTGLEDSLPATFDASTRGVLGGGKASLYGGWAGNGSFIGGWAGNGSFTGGSLWSMAAPVGRGSKRVVVVAVA
jgi:hypothetical protein